MKQLKNKAVQWMRYFWFICGIVFWFEPKLSTR